jgi:hypothetical protein
VALASDQLATSYYYAADPLPAVANLVRGVNRAERVNAPVAESSARLGFIAGAAGLQRLSRRYFDRARTRSEGDRAAAHHAAALYMAAMDDMGHCRWRSCQRDADESAELFERIGDRHEAATAQAIAANGLFYEGQIGEALERVRRLEASARARGNVLHEAWGCFLAARSYVAAGVLDGMTQMLEEVRADIVTLPETLSIAMCEGTLALALCLEGNLPRAAEIANALLERLCSNNPWVPQCLDGYASCAEVLLLEWARAGAREGTDQCHAARTACRQLRRFAGRFPLAVPAALRCTGWERALLGRTNGASRAIRQSIRAAEARAMPFEEARGRFLASRLLPDALQRERQWIEAQRLLVELECERLIEVLEALPLSPDVSNTVPVVGDA